MCGIAGFLDLQGGRPLSASRLDRMVDAMYSRGPDDRGVSRKSNAALGMRRLSIIDLEGGHQPIANSDDSVRVVMNGEIYNHEEVRRELEARGRKFATRSDTEVLVHGYEEWGLDGLLGRLNGMFAFALQDERRETVWLVRDRLGIKPLLYTVRDGYLLFGSSHHALLASGLVDVVPDMDAVELYMLLQYVPGTHSALAGVRKLAPAHYLQIRGGEVSEPTRWWSIPEPDASSRPHAEWIDEVKHVLSDAVRMHMVSDVEVGLFLSGGLDSTLILGLMREATDLPIRAYSIGFEDKRVFDESAHAKAAADRFGATFVPRLFTADDVLGQVDPLMRDLDEPIGDAACLPTLLLSQMARADLKVVLSGEGADELFAGYGYYQQLPPKNATFGTNFDPGESPSLLARVFGGAKRGAMTISGNFHGTSAISGFPYVLSPAFLEHLLPAAGRGRRSVVERAHALESAWAGETADPLQRALRVDASGWLPDDLLMKVDRTTMAHSLEARVPFLDWRVAELAFRMPSELKLDGKVGKACLREAFKELLGEQFEKREKHGFNLPMHEWMRDQLRPLVTSSLLDDTPEWLDRASCAALLDAHATGRAQLERALWCLFVLTSWFRTASARAAEAKSQ